MSQVTFALAWKSAEWVNYFKTLDEGTVAGRTSSYDPADHNFSFSFGSDLHALSRGATAPPTPSLLPAAAEIYTLLACCLLPNSKRINCP